MPSYQERKYSRVISYIEDVVGADVNRDLLKVALAADDLEGLTVGLKDIGGQAQSAIDVANKIDKIEDTLASVDSDSLLVDSNNPLDVSAAEVDVDLNSQSLTPITVTDDGSFGIASEVDVDINSQSLTPLTVTDDGGFVIVDSSGSVIEEPLDVSDSVVEVKDVTGDEGHEYQSESQVIEQGEVYTVAKEEVWYVDDLVVNGRAYIEGDLIYYGSISGTGTIKGGGRVMPKE